MSGAPFAHLIRNVNDFPRPGIVFKDITPLLSSASGFADAVAAMVDLSPREIDAVVGAEARGFIFGAGMALAMGVGFVPVRKPGKLPGENRSVTYDLEYGTETLEMSHQALKAGSRVLIVDDVLATGGTVAATAGLLAAADIELAGVTVLLELEFLGGRGALRQQGIEAVESVIAVAS